MAKPVEQLDRVIIRFAGDSGDGMQLTGDRFTSETALLGNDLATLPDFPAEIRAPAGSLPGVSGFQVHFADHDILTPGDQPDVLVAMNPAALKTNLEDLPKGGTLIVNTDAFNDRNLQKAGYEANPLADGSLDGVPRPRGGAHVDDRGGAEGRRGDHLARGGALEELLRARADVVALPPADRGDARLHRGEVRQAARDRRGEHAAPSRRATTTARRPRTSPSRTRSRPRSSRPARYRQITGNTALSYGLIAASKLSGLPLFLGAYPITPASVDPRGARAPQALRRRRRSRPRTRSPRAAPRSARRSAARSASRPRPGPGVVLKAETVGLAITLELPLLILDIQRAGPSTGMPTKPEQADLLMVLSAATRRARCP